MKMSELKAVEDAGIEEEKEVKAEMTMNPNQEDVLSGVKVGQDSFGEDDEEGEEGIQSTPGDPAEQEKALEMLQDYVKGNKP